MSATKDYQRGKLVEMNMRPLTFLNIELLECGLDVHFVYL